MFFIGRKGGETYPVPARPAATLQSGVLATGPNVATPGVAGTPIEFDFENIQFQIGEAFWDVSGGQLRITQAGIYFMSVLIGYDAPGAHSVFAPTIAQGGLIIGLSPATGLSAAQACGHIAPGYPGSPVPARMFATFTPGSNGNVQASGAAIFIQKFIDTDFT